MAIFGSVIGGGLLGLTVYLVNLPFMFLVARSPFFQSRFQNVLRLTPAVPVVPSAAREVPVLDAVLATMPRAHE
jgi:hypothetical protein